jgi:hypothetical protein
MKNLCVAAAMIPNAASQIRATASATSAQSMTEGAIAPKKKCAFPYFFGIAGEWILQLLGFGNAGSLLR